MRPMKPCKRCGHAFADHAADVNYPDALRCFHRAATGDGCAEKYSERCKEYIDPDLATIEA